MADDVPDQLAHQQFCSEYEIIEPPCVELLPNVFPGLTRRPGIVREVEGGDILGGGAAGFAPA